MSEHYHEEHHHQTELTTHSTEQEQTTPSTDEQEQPEETSHVSDKFLPLTFGNLKPHDLFSCSMVCIQWCQFALDALDSVSDEIWCEVANTKWGWAVKKYQTANPTLNINIWKDWYKQWKTKFNDARSGWVQFVHKKQPLLLWMNTECTGLALYKQYKEERFLFIHLERGIEVSRADKKGKPPNSVQITTSDNVYNFSCTKPFERDAWFTVIDEMIETYHPSRTREEIHNNEDDKKKSKVGKSFLKSFTSSIRGPPPAANQRESKLHVEAHNNIVESEDKKTSSPTHSKNSIKDRVTRQMMTQKSPNKIELKKQHTISENENPLPSANENDETSPIEQQSQDQLQEQPSEQTQEAETTTQIETDKKQISDQANLFSIDSAIETNDQHDILYKIIIIGNSGVGKSVLLGRWLTNKFTSANATISGDVSLKTFPIDQKIIKVQFWDTAGQEAHFAMTRSYFRKSHGAIVVYDVTQASSFFDVQKWVAAVRDAADNVQFMLIGNKSDLKDSREVTTAMGLELARREHLNFMETSALNGNNVHRAFQILLQDIHKAASLAPLEGSILDTLKEQAEGATVSLFNPNQTKNQPNNQSCCEGNVNINTMFST